MTSRTRIHAVWLHTFSWSGAIEVTILEAHLRDQMTSSRGSMRDLVPKIENDSFDPKSWLLEQPFAPYGRSYFERTEKNWNAKLLAGTEDPCPHAPRKRLQKIPRTERDIKPPSCPSAFFYQACSSGGGVIWRVILRVEN